MSTARGLNRDQVIQISWLSGRENFVRTRKIVFNTSFKNNF